MGINVKPMGRLRKDFKRIENENERAGVCKRLRTELMTGKGADIYILSEYQRNGGLFSVDEDRTYRKIRRMVLWHSYCH